MKWNNVPNAQAFTGNNAIPAVWRWVIVNIVLWHSLNNLPTQQNFYIIGHLLDTVTTQWLDNDSVVTVDNFRQYGDIYDANDSVDTVLPAVNNIALHCHCPVTMQSLCLVGDWRNKSFAVYMVYFCDCCFGKFVSYHYSQRYFS